MMTLRKILLLVVVIGCCAASPLNARSRILPDKQCSSPAGCSSNECCVTQPIRYSTPLCSPLRLEGEPCVPNPREFNSTTLYPDGSEKLHTDIFWVLCPCAPHLTCDWDSGLCSSSSKSPPSPLNQL